VDKITEILNQETSNDFEFPIFQSNDSTRWVRMSHSTFQSENLIEIILVDITDDKKRIKDLERINQQLDQFVYHISHDLRSPLTTLLGLLNLSKKTTNSIETLQEYIDLMHKRTLHLDSILLDLTSIVLNEKTALELEPFDAAHEIHTILSHYDDARLLFDTKIIVDHNSEFNTDIKRLRVILRNLISNAVKYQNPAEARPIVHITISIKRERAFIEIGDNGIGIHPQYMEKVFDMFFRGTDASSGSGLGLYIVKSMVDKMGGTISLLSEPQKGSLFLIKLPNQTQPLLGKKHQETSVSIL
jgi:signal transduction histidine kinase